METVAIDDIHRFEFTDVDVRLYGDVAVVLSSYHQEASVAGEPHSGDFLITDIWHQRYARRQVVARSYLLLSEGSTLEVGSPASKE